MNDSTTLTTQPESLNKSQAGHGDDMVQADCHTHGPYMARKEFAYENGLGTFETTTPCPTCQKEDAERRRKERRKYVHQWYRNSGIPFRFQQKDFSHFDADTKEQENVLAIIERYAEHWPDMQAKGTSLVLCGKPGTGKTHLACALIHSVIYKHADTALYRTASALVREVRNTWGNGSKDSESEILGRFTSTRLLVIDEIGVQNGTESERNILFEVINGRYERLRPTVIIGNVPYPEMDRFVGDRVLDRLREGDGVVIPFTWDSHRGRAEVIPAGEQSEPRKPKHRPAV